MDEHNKSCLPDGWEIAVAKTKEDIEQIRPVWEQMQAEEPYPVINADVDRYLSVVKAYGHSEVQPYILLISKDDRPIAMLISRIEEMPLKLKLGYKTLFSPTLKCLRVAYGGVIGQATNDVYEMLFMELMNTLSRREADIVQFNHLRIDSPLYELAKTLPNFLCRGYFPKVEDHWSMSVPESLEQFYRMRSKKHRANLRRYLRRLDEQYSNRTRVVTVTPEDELDGAIAAASRISQSTYQHGMGCGFVDNLWARTLLATAAKQGWLRMSVLYIDEEPGAFQIGLHYHNRYLLDYVGFDPRWCKLELGTVLFLRVMEHICADPDIEFVDFGFGDAEYKRSYADKQWQEVSVYIFAKRPYSIFINMVRISTIGLNRGLEYVLNKTGLRRWTKRRWRNLLRVRATEKTR